MNNDTYFHILLNFNLFCKFVCELIVLKNYVIYLELSFYKETIYTL